MCGFERTALPDNGGPLMPSEDTDQIATCIAQKLRDAGSSAILYPAPTATTLGAIRRDRVIVVVSLALLAAFAWSYLLWLSVDMGMGGMDLTGFRIIPSGMGLMMPTHTPSRAIEFAFVFAMWTVMMVGMMTPSAMPMIIMYARVGRHAEAQGTPLVATVWFVAGYLLVWVAFALLATLVQGALEHTALLDSTMVNTNNVLGGLRVSSCGQLPVDPPQGRMSYPMPDAVGVPDASWWLSPGRAELPSARDLPWRVLRRLLLGADGAVVRRDEPAVDRPDLATRFLGEGHFLGPSDRCSCRYSPGRGRGMVVFNGNFLKVSTLEPHRRQHRHAARTSRAAS